MGTKYKLFVETGVKAGSSFDIGDSGASIGRSAKNDISLPDGMLSRRHCKIFFKDGEAWISDLATLNGTSVNDAPLKDEAKLSKGDRIGIGDTVLVFADADYTPGAAGDKQAGREAAAKEIDLGFRTPASATDEHGAAGAKRIAVRAAIAFVALCAAAIVLQIFMQKSGPKAAEGPATPAERTLEIRYVKTEASAINIFRYELVLDKAGFLTVAIDDIDQGRHVRKTTDKPISKEAREGLVRKFEQAEFSSMPPLAEGIPLANSWNVAALTAVIDGEVKTVAVRNKTDLDQLRRLRDDIEAFGRSELGLWAVELSSDRLMERAQTDRDLARKFFAEREISPDNLHRAMQAYKSCIAYLETIEPKPDFYNEVVMELADAEKEMDAVYRDKSWEADHAMNTRRWDEAAAILRELLDFIPDRTDERNIDATKRLLEVEARLRQEKK